MRTTIRQLRVVIKEAYRRLRVVDTSPRDEDEREKPMGSVELGREKREGDAQAQIDDLRDRPGFEDLDSFMTMKLDDDDLSYDFIELQALARNAASERVGKRTNGADQVDIDKVRRVLDKEMGFKFIPRKPIKDVRGTQSGSHGTSPFAGMGGGGSGFGSDREGGNFTSFGGGPGAIGGKYDWDPNDKKNLPMGATKRKKPTA